MPRDPFGGSGSVRERAGSRHNVIPVHVGLPSMGRVDIEVTAMTPRGRKVTRMTGIAPGAVVTVGLG